MYLHLRVDVHSGTRTQYRSLQTPRTCVSFYSELVSWMYLHLRVDAHPGTRIQYHSL
ncbi:unnamed protein product [Schistosoma mattheei]|uniref:Uncharacterized protein n=1 Tax=Schistosoma mattheei TaxID=31246 RepID=A0A183NVX9_9TREM|nr:unnamed protein product [Schistosoma mattheei]